MNTEKCCLIAVRVCGQERAAVKVCIRNSNVYVNYFDRDGKQQLHTSYHASGQKHHKKNRDYVYWTGGVSGKWEPMKWFKTPPAQVMGRERVSVIGWEVGSLVSVLPSLIPQTRAEILELPAEPEFTIVGFEISVVGTDAQPRDNILGFPIFWHCRISDAISVEVEAFGINEALVDQAFS